MSDNQPTTPAISGESAGLKPGDIFWNNYRVIGVIGKGGVSTVYKAETVDNKQVVAIKVLHANRSKDEELVRRFVRECQTTTKLEHPHAIKILDWGIDDLERPFMIIEFLNGDTLSKRIQRSNGLHHQKAVEIMEQICSAIAEAHNLGIIHRDLKPENIMLTTHNGLEDWVKVVDFGIAKLETNDNDPASVAQASLTRTGAILGTPLYMSPEQLRGRKADARSDIYALGVIMYEMLTGKPPFTSKNTAEIVVGHLNVIPELPTKIRMDLNIPTALSEATLRALAKNPWERPTTVQEFAGSLHKAIEKPDRPRQKANTPPPSDPIPEAIIQAQTRTPTPHGMIVDPVKKVCPNCQSISEGANYRYCLKCGQDNTNKWLPYHRRKNERVHARTSGLRRIAFLIVLGILSTWAVQSYLAHGTELTGRFEGTFDHPLFSTDKRSSKQLRISALQMLLSQHGDSVTGLITTKFGQDAVEGKVTQISPMILGYELSSSIQKPTGRLDLELAGTFDKVTKTEDWNYKAFFQGNQQKPLTDVGRLRFRQITD
jgi:serine/threonine protein kinase